MQVILFLNEYIIMSLCILATHEYRLVKVY